MRAGMKAGLPIAGASLLLAISFGVLARPVMGEVAPIVMSADPPCAAAPGECAADAAMATSDAH